MYLFEVFRSLVCMVLLLIPGFLLTYFFFQSGKLRILERILIGFSISIALTTILLYSANKIFGINLNLITVISIIILVIIAAIIALLVNKSFPSKIFWPVIQFSWSGLRLYLGLALILAFAFFMAFIPHLHYAYPIHVDEWYNLGWSQAITNAKTISFHEPFLGEWTVFDNSEIGFQLFLAQIKFLTGLSWISIFLILPAVIFTLTVLTSFTIGQRANFGLGAAFFVALIPTSVRFLGPSFLVPSTLGLFFLAAVLFLFNSCEINRVNTFVLFLLLAFLYLSHPPTGVAASLLCLIYGVRTFWKSEKRGMARWQTTLLILGSAFVSSFIYIARFMEQSSTMAAQLVQPESLLPFISDAWIKFGFIPVGLAVVGIGFLTYKNSSMTWGLIVSACTFLAIILFYRQLDIGVFVLYERGFLYFFLLAGIIAGASIKIIREYLSRLLAKFPKKASFVSLSIVTILALTAGGMSLHSHFSEPYYHLISENEYHDFLWIKKNLDNSYRKALINPTISIAFSAITGKSIYVSNAMLISWYPERLNEVNEFLQGNCSDTTWLIERNIDILYTELPVSNPDLKEIHDRVYLVPKINTP